MRILQTIVTGLFFSFLLPAQTTGTTVPDHVPGRLIVLHRSSTTDVNAQRALAAQGAKVHRRLDALGATLIEVAPGTEESARQALSRNPLFRAVQYDYYAHAGATPNDQYF